MSFTKNNIFENSDNVKSILLKILGGREIPPKDTNFDPDQDETHSVNPDDIGIHHGRTDKTVTEDEEVPPKYKTQLPPKEMARFHEDHKGRPQIQGRYDALSDHYKFTNGSGERVSPISKISYGHQSFDDNSIVRPSYGNDRSPENHELHHLYEYTKSSSSLNRHLYTTHEETKKKYKLNDTATVAAASKKLSNPSSVHHVESVKGIDSATSANKTPHDLTLYTGSGLNPLTFKNRKLVSHLSAYTSTSLSPDVASDRASPDTKDRNVLGNYNKQNEKHMMAIHWPAGSKGAYVEHASEYGFEKEFVMPRNVGLRHSHTESYTRKDSPDMLHVHHMYPVYGHKD